ncbi:YfhD family protein [Paenibacillus sp. 19GGS1-52]|uniref:YfhD family protein n=1 Tax=Paenibacillus sp. 19GGS1-52 TaxID=2758563 RepID=UPI001EFC16D9|nr:YfhD family protein [Paenibacillus sp. 19GGS1-52]ULO08797.1 YfhD family protein [Paenibacillus sp. 19GGS1-52]
MDRENSKIYSKTDKLKMLYEAKNEDVEFSAAEADQEDVEAQARSVEADKRQLHEILKKE